MSWRGLLSIGAVALWAGAAVAGSDPSYGPPEAWVKPVPLPTGGAAADGAPAQVVLYEVQGKLGAKDDEYFVEKATKILAPEGLGPAGEVSETWDPDTEDLTIHHLRVIRGGQVIDALAGGQKLLVLRRENKLELAMLDGRLTATFEPEGLQVGDVVDFSYTVVHHDPALQGYSEDYDQLQHTGVASEIYWREFWAADKPMRYRMTEGLPAPVITKTADGAEVLFDMRDISAPKPPVGAPTRFFDLGAVEYSQYADWAQLSGLLSPLWDKATTLPADSPLRAEVAKIAAASQDPKTRAEGALRLVQEETRYVFLGMNDGGLVPADADATWARRFGDCKGKTALLVAVLRQLGVTAEPVLVSTTYGDGMDQRLPMAAWFDHAIVRAEIGGKTYWLDGTRIGDRSLDDLTVPPYHWALPVRPSGAALIKLDPTPLTKPGTAVTLTVDASKGPDAPAPTHIEILYRGEDAAALRQTLASVPRSDYERYLRDFWTKADPWFDVQTVSEGDDPATGLPRLTADGTGRLDWSVTTAGGRYYRVPHTALGGDVTFKRQPGPHQDAPYAVTYPFYSTDTWKITLPADGNFLLVGADVDKTLAGQELRRTSRIENGVLTVAISIQATEPEFPASEADADSAGLRDLAKSDVAVAYRVGPVPATPAKAQNDTAIRSAAEGGDAAAAFRLGVMYANGQGVPFDRAQAIAWTQKAADKGYAPAQAALGGAYLRGDGVSQDFDQALTWLRKAADQDNADAEADLGYLYIAGKGVPSRDPAQAFAMFQKSAGHGNANGEFGLASLYLFGQGAPKDEAQAFAWTRKAAEQGLARAAGQLALMYQLGTGVTQDTAQALVWDNKAAALGDTRSMRAVGWAYQHALGAPQDYAQAMTWYRKAADAGDPDADMNVAQLYALGLGVPKDLAQALDWTRKAANLGLPIGEYAYGQMLRAGEGAPPDGATGVVWLRKAAEQGLADAQAALGQIYMDGQGVPKDEAQARLWLQKAALQGNQAAQYSLARLSGQNLPAPLNIAPVAHASPPPAVSSPSLSETPRN